MICSEARLIANRANAQKSTGPRTPEGKAVSRANSLTHGLCASVCVPEDPRQIRERNWEFFDALRPQNEYHTWLVDQVAVASIRIDRAVRIERRVRDKVALHAELSWDDDRRLEAERVGARLARDPGGTVEMLRRSPHGCEWLMARWAMLAHAAEANKGWTAEQDEIAFDLLGTPRAFRAGVRPGTAIDFEGRVVEPADDPAAVARRMVAELRERREAVAGLDEVERSLTMADLTDDSDKELRNLRRYEATLHRRLRWAVAQIKGDAAGKSHAKPGLTPRWARQAEPEKPTEDEALAKAHPPGSAHPPFDLDPEEVPPLGQRPDIPAILLNRKQKRIAKAEARRQARRKRAEQLRA